MNRAFKKGIIKKFTRPRLDLISITVDIDGTDYDCHLWGKWHRMDIDHLTEDEYEDYVCSQDDYIKSKFFNKFNVDYENCNCLIGKPCWCQKCGGKYNRYGLMRLV